MFILTDDLSWNLITPQIAPHITALEKQGETFSNYYVTDSLCCPSRSTIFTGLFPHDTKVQSNMPPVGGFQKFQAQHLDTRTFAVALHGTGYSTSMLGKYLNGYGDPKMTASTAPVPPGWTDWHVSNSTGYLEYNYLLNDNGKFDSYTSNNDYGVDVINRDAQSFITTSRELAVLRRGRDLRTPRALHTSKAQRQRLPRPHRTPRPVVQHTEHQSAGVAGPAASPPPEAAREHREELPETRAGRGVGGQAPRRHRSDTRGAASHQRHLHRVHLRQRYHLGQHRLARGKQTAFDTDIRVPLIVSGPGVPNGRSCRK